MPRANVTAYGYRQAPQTPQRWVVSGVTRDSGGAPLAGCTVDLFEAGSRLLRGTTVSDASGVYSIDVTQPPLTFYVVCYLAGSPDVSGMSDFTIVGTPG